MRRTRIDLSAWLAEMSTFAPWFMDEMKGGRAFFPLAVTKPA